MAKDLWQFTGVTYDNRLITVEEEIDRSFSRSDAERLCKSRNGFKEIRTSSPISRPLKKRNKKSKKSKKSDYGSINQSGDAGIFLQLIFSVFIGFIIFSSLYAFFIKYVEYI